MQADSVIFYTIYRETSNRLEVLRCRVQEGRDVMAASEFARWLNFSGICKLLEVNSQTEPVAIDGALLQSKCNDLISMCNDRFKTGDTKTHLEKSQIAALHEKIDLMAGYLSRVSLPPAGAPVALAKDPMPEFSPLVVIPGGRPENVHEVVTEPDDATSEKTVPKAITG